MTPSDPKQMSVEELASAADEYARTHLNLTEPQADLYHDLARRLRSLGHNRTLEHWQLGSSNFIREKLMGLLGNSIDCDQYCRAGEEDWCARCDTVRTCARALGIILED